MSSLKNLKIVKEDLKFQNNTITNLSLDSLKEVNCEIVIKENNKLTDLNLKSLDINKNKGLSKNFEVEDSKQLYLDNINIELTDVDNKYQGYSSGVLAKNGKIYCPPFGTYESQKDKVLEIDPTKEPVTFKYVGGDIGTPEQFGKYYGGVLANNGKIYCPPYGLEPETDKNTNEILVIDPSYENNNTLIPLPEIDSSGQKIDWVNKRFKYGSGVLANNGKIYCAPHGEIDNDDINTNTNVILVIDPSDENNNTVIPLPVPNGQENYWNNKLYKYDTGVLANNGKIYYPPFGENVGDDENNTNVILVIDPSDEKNNTVIPLPVPENEENYWNKKNYKFGGGVLANNGKIYCPPYGEKVGDNENTNVILVIDPSDEKNNTVIHLPVPYEKEENYWDNKLYKYYGGVLANNGKIYYPPTSRERVLVITPNEKDEDVKVEFIEEPIIGTDEYEVKYNGGVLAHDGKIYCPPDTFSKLLVIDPSGES